MTTRLGQAKSSRYCSAMNSIVPPLAELCGPDDIRLERSAHELPVGFAALEADAKADGHRHLTRLAAELNESPNIFHAMFSCYVGSQLAGIGGVTDEPAPTSTPTWRMRRLYVHRAFRRRNIARIIVTALLLETDGNADDVTVHAGNDGAAKFWEEIGFQPVVGRAWSHQATVPDLILRSQ